MNDVTAWIPLGGALLILLGTWITVRATRGKTQTDYKTAMEKRLDEKMSAYTDKLEERVKSAEDKAETLKERVDHLEDAQEESTKREKLLYKYTASLRDHILNNNPPPPPRLPTELLDWYKSYETGETGIPR